MVFRVKDVYKGSSVLITGATGFLGKVIVEKLLWSIDDIDDVFLLIRTRKGKSARERLEGLLLDPLFSRLHQQKPDVLKKLIPIEGDVTLESLGIRPDEKELIQKKVSVVIHSAATVRFDEHLRPAVAMNVVGTRSVVELCREIEHLKVLVHVSTAYANCDRAEVLEKIYPSPFRPQTLIDEISRMDDRTVTELTPRLLGLRPNTYTLTKALAETVLESEAKGIPVIIVRPSIVGAMWRGPLPGWSDNFNGPTGLWAAVGSGCVTDLHGNAEAIVDLIPVDCVANMIIVAAAYRTTINPEKVPVIHCCSGLLNPICYGKSTTFVEQFFRQMPLENCLGVPSARFHKSRLVFLANYYVKHQIPAAIANLASRCVGGCENNVNRYRRVWKMIETTEFFLNRSWNFDSRGLVNLVERMTPEDRNEFNFDVRSLNWETYLFDYLMGVREYVLKEDLTNLRTARVNLFKLRIRRQSVYALYSAAIIVTIGWGWEMTTKFLLWSGAVLLTFILTEVNWNNNLQLKESLKFDII